MSFPSERHFVNLLRLAPHTAISGGKPLRKKKPNGTGATRIAGVLRMAALYLQRSRTTLGAAFRRKARHKGAAVAVFAITRKLTTPVYRMLRYSQDYVDIGEQAYEPRVLRQRFMRRLNPSAPRSSRRRPSWVLFRLIKINDLGSGFESVRFPLSGRNVENLFSQARDRSESDYPVWSGLRTGRTSTGTAERRSVVYVMG